MNRLTTALAALCAELGSIRDAGQRVEVGTVTGWRVRAGEAAMK